MGGLDYLKKVGKIEKEKERENMKKDLKQLKEHRILAMKCINEIKNYCRRIENEIEKSHEEQRFLNIKVWIESIKKEIEILKLVEELSVKQWREFKKLD